jgi:hypothetical protein
LTGAVAPVGVAAYDGGWHSGLGPLLDDEEAHWMMKIVLEKVSPETLARYLENKLLRVYGITPMSEGYKPNIEDEMRTFYNVELLVLGKLKQQFADLLEGKPAQ